MLQMAIALGGRSTCAGLYRDHEAELALCKEIRRTSALLTFASMHLPAIYSIYTSPNHAPIPNHLPTLIVTPYGQPHHTL